MRMHWEQLNVLILQYHVGDGVIYSIMQPVWFVDPQKE